MTFLIFAQRLRHPARSAGGLDTPTMFAALAFALGLLAAVAGAARASDASVDAAVVFDRRASAEIDRLVRDVCRRDIVLLGEDANHGGGHTFEIKTELVKRLAARCGFGAVVFESQFYDLLAHARAVDAGTATAGDLADAIGPLWSRAQEAQPLIAFLHAETMAGRLRVAGIDPQVGGISGHYTRRELGGALAAALDGEPVAACRAEIDRHNGWRYDDAQPFDDAAQRRLRACSDAIRAAIASKGIDPASELAAMAVAYARYLDMALDGDGDMRDLGMFEALQWHRARWPKGTKIMVWCATVHAAKRLDGVAPEMRPLGAHVHAAYGDRAAAIGFTARSGAFGNPGASGTPNALTPAAPHALEAVALGDGDAQLRYVDRKRLRKLGTIAARPINYRTTHAAPWAEMLDGILVLREERAATPLPRR
ncbi:erythromycin esterase family protein [Lysobacter hankyongensis]|uniref:Erythromycin esterase family protein n=1 Tax=Lysobacter hankyongensis TaxID=1176535 RepID=A0ABP9BCC5_9GAMM